MSYVLILFIYAGAMAKGDSVTLTHERFESKELCEMAGKEAEELTKGTFKNTKYICVRSK